MIDAVFNTENRDSFQGISSSVRLHLRPASRTPMFKRSPIKSKAEGIYIAGVATEASGAHANPKPTEGTEGLNLRLALVGSTLFRHELA